MGWCAFYAADADMARECQQRAVELFELVGDLEGKSGAQYGLAGVSIRAQDADAVDLVQAALDTARSAGDRFGEARALNGLGILYADSGADLEAAERVYDQSRTIFEELGDALWASTITANLAYRRIQAIDVAKHEPEHFAPEMRRVIDETTAVIERLAALDSPRAPVLRAFARGVRVQALVRMGNLEAAQSEIDDIESSGSSLVTETEIMLAEARAHILAVTDEPGALESIEHAEQLARRARLRSSITASLRTKVEILEKMGRYADALEAHRDLLEAELRWSGDPSAATSAGARGHIRAQLAKADIGQLTQRAEELEASAAQRANWVLAVSHELRTPITAILGLATELSERWEQLADEAPLLVETIQDEARDLAHIIDDLLTEARLTEGGLHIEAEAFAASELVHAVVAVVARDFSVSVEGDGDAYADPTRVRQIIRNLLTNAERYGGDTIEVVIQSRHELTDVSVRDSGAGIPLDQREAIFEPFGRADAARSIGKSVGLGLSVSRDLARAMGGDLTYSHVDGWSVFTLLLPARPN